MVVAGGPGRPVLPVLLQGLDPVADNQSQVVSALPSCLPLAWFFHLTLQKPHKPSLQQSSWSGIVSGDGCETIQPKTQTAATDMFEETLQLDGGTTKTEGAQGKEGTHLAQLGWSSGSCYTPSAS